MPHLFRKLFRRAKKRIKSGLRDLRTWRLYQAGRQILAEQDEKHLHIAKLSAMAGMSVGAFYERFRSKEAFISFLINERFASAQWRAKNELTAARFADASSATIVEALVNHTLVTLHGPTSGVVKAALKRERAEDRYGGPLGNYRTAVANHALSLLMPKMGRRRDAERRIRTAIQIMHAVAIDALHHDDGPLRRGRKHTVIVLSAVMSGYIDQFPQHRDEAEIFLASDERIDISEEFEPHPATLHRQSPKAPIKRARGQTRLV